MSSGGHCGHPKLMLTPGQAGHSLCIPWISFRLGVVAAVRLSGLTSIEQHMGGSNHRGEVSGDTLRTSLPTVVGLLPDPAVLLT